MVSEFKLNVGPLAEDAVQAAVERAISHHFVFRSPKKLDNKEVTDVLALFGDLAIVLASKSQAVGSQGSSDQPTLRWASKNIKKAGRQISGAVRSLRGRKVASIENARHGRVEFDPETYPFVHGLIVLHHSSRPYKAIDEVPDLARINAPVHVLSYRDFANLASLLDTPGDLINYLDARAELLIPTLDPRVHEEELAFRYYIENLQEIHLFLAKHHGEPLTEVDIRSYAEGMQRLMNGEIDRAPGRVVDAIIDRCHETDFSLRSVGGAPMADSEGKWRIATHLAGIPRLRRIALGRRYLRIAGMAQDTSGTTKFLSMSKKRGDCLVLMSSALPREQRENRREELTNLTRLARVYCGAARAMGVATEEAGRMGSSFDFAYIEGAVVSPNNEEDFKELGREVFGELSGRLDRDP